MKRLKPREVLRIHLACIGIFTGKLVLAVINRRVFELQEISGSYLIVI